MAFISPTYENIERLKVKPEPGESFLIDYLAENLSNEYTIYYQPFLNGDKPDFVIEKKDTGICIIEVKDWNLDIYSVDIKNTWSVLKVGGRWQPIRSPFQQVFYYKKRLFDLHCDGLTERKILDPHKKYFGMFHCLVYFGDSSQKTIDDFYSPPLFQIKERQNTAHNNFRDKKCQEDDYKRKLDWLNTKKEKLERDKEMTVHQDNILKIISKKMYRKNKLFTDDISDQLRRYLVPPHHAKNDGKHIEYGGKQLRLIKSKPECKKIKGPAGTGKTCILAKRAVNAHKRHNDNVLILTYNKTLKSCIHDKISNVREDFPWNVFCIMNYHQFINQQINKCGIHFNEDEDDTAVFQRYSDESLFTGYEKKVDTYKTILIDEIQDYRPSWIKIIKKYFLTHGSINKTEQLDGEMVLLGDDCQNVYERHKDKKTSDLISLKGFGPWERLKKSYRAKDQSAATMLAKDFQEQYLLAKYNMDLPTIGGKESDMFYRPKGWSFSNIENDRNEMIKCIYIYLKTNKIHPNDTAIICSNIEIIRSLDYYIRQHTNEKTMTTFETEEDYIELKKRKGALKIQTFLDSIRDSKKASFNANNGMLKLATTHSFKGFETPTAIAILLDTDSTELIYTAITRTGGNLLLFIQKNSIYLNFFKRNPNIDFQRDIFSTDQIPF